MLAHHPLTGKPIRILRTDASLWKENKLLRWAAAGTEPWPAVDTLSDGCLAGGIWPEFLYCRGTELIEAAAKNCRLLFLPRAIAEEYGIQTFVKKGIQNILCIEELSSLFPHVGEEWDGTMDDLATIIALLLRYRVLAGAWNSRAEGRIRRYEGSCPRLWWVTQYFVPDKSKRARELARALRMNVESPLIDRIVLLNEKHESLPLQSDKIEERVIGKRLTYADVISTAATFPEDVILVFANADIAIDTESWRDLWSLNLSDKFLALLRYDVGEDGSLKAAQLFGPRADSQDTWVLRVSDIVKRGPSLWKGLDFRFGQMGCDNAVALEMLRQKFLCVNPALTLKTWHFHASGLRNYQKNDVLDRPIFHYIEPTGVHDLNPLTTLQPESKREQRDLMRCVKGSGATTWLVNSNRVMASGAQPLVGGGAENRLNPGPVHVVRLNDAFMTKEGVFYDQNHLYIGPSEKAKQAWGKVELQPLQPTISCMRALCAPWPSEAAQDREVYLVQYLAKILRLWGEAGAGEFYCPETKAMQEVLDAFVWGIPKVNVIKYEKDIQVSCKELVGMTRGDQECVTGEDVDALRKFVKAWEPETRGTRLRIVLVEDESVCTNALTTELEEVLDRAWDVRVLYAGRSSADRCVDMMRGAWGVVCGPGLKSSAWNWMLPVGGRVFEVVGGGAQEGLHMSGAAGLQHRFVVAKKDAILEEIWAESEAVPVAVSVKEDAPIVWMPRRDLTGYFGHPGDSFREMVRMWATAGYIRLKEHPTATMVWWQAVGREGVLLYDRPNHDWRLAAPMEEREWKFALFGNPAVPLGAEADTCSSWMFWPRRPSFAEELVDSGRATAGWDARRYRMVFYGKTENKVQERRRTVADWRLAFIGQDYDWQMVKGEEPYKLSQREYLERLSDSRFGLCLAGYGLKCHREVECMAMGCVPLVAPEVDMTNYVEPPVEGVHFFRVKTPEEARKLSEEVTKDTWEAMSAAGRDWWSRNASMAGSFALTKRLIESHQKA